MNNESLKELIDEMKQRLGSLEQFERGYRARGYSKGIENTKNRKEELAKWIKRAEEILEFEAL